MALKIEDIIDAIRNNRIRITEHADDECQADRLSFDYPLTKSFSVLSAVRLLRTIRKTNRIRAV